LKRRITVWTWLLWLALPFLLWLAWRQIPIDRLWELLQGIKPWQFGILAALDALILLSFNSRWWLILRAQGYTLPYLWLTAYRLAGFAISYLTPGMQFGGEPMQAALLHRRHKLPVPVSIASLTLDKLLELLTNFFFLTIVLLVALINTAFLPAFQLNLAWPLLGLMILPLAHLVMLRQGIRPITWLAAGLAGKARSPRFDLVHQMVLDAENRVGALCKDHAGILGLSILFSLAGWTLAIFEHWLVYASLGLPLTISQLMLLIAAMRLAFLTPLPGGLGALEAGQVLALQALGLDPAVGVGAVLWIRLRDLGLAGAGAWLGAALSRPAPVVSLPEEVAV
jgi:hypothetical protein